MCELDSIDDDASPKTWNLPTSLHGAKTQNIIIIIHTALKTSNLTWIQLV
jgi:hypothetical protein